MIDADFFMYIHAIKMLIHNGGQGKNSYNVQNIDNFEWPINGFHDESK